MLIPLFILLPLFAFVVCCLFPNRFERIISGIAVTTIVAVFALFVRTLITWGQGGFAPLSHAGLTVFSNPHYEFALSFYMDTVSVVFFGMTCLTTILVLLFSKYYMHRDPGFRRFHSTILFFFVGLALIIFSGNFETLFVGWEFIGISSFLLISFYRDRFLPTKNSLKVFSLYRIGDALFILALWLAHHYFGHSVQFAELKSLIGLFGNSFSVLGVLWLIVSLIKSAQFPFSYWLPRAMEGPTVSSAIFYGALSVHIGLFLLLRTYPLWEGSLWLRIVIMCIGLASALFATSITRVQSSIKTQIAYASVTQIGIMFIELAAGFHSLVLFHFVSNACLRTYQLLISPSILSYLIHHQMYEFVLPKQKIGQNLVGKIRSTLFVLGIKEWNMDSTMTHIVWQPLKRIGQWVRFLDAPLLGVLGAVLVFIGGLLAYRGTTSHQFLDALMWFSGILSVLLFIRAYASKGRALVCWTQIFFGQLFVSLFLGILSGASVGTAMLYLSGIVVAYLVGVGCLVFLQRKMGPFTLLEFHGFMYAHPAIGDLFFIACLAMIAFPITPSFFGEEVLLSLTHVSHGAEMVLFAAGYVFLGISVMRLFAKVFFGPHKKTYHEIAYLTS